MRKESLPFYVDARVNRYKFTKALIDNSCTSYATVNGYLVKSLDLPRIRLNAPRRLDSIIRDLRRIIYW